MRSTTSLVTRLSDISIRRIEVDAARMQHTLEGVLGVPFTAGNRLQALRNGIEYFPAMLKAIRNARYSIEFITCVYWEGDIADIFAEALAERARAGVRVRALLDRVGSRPMGREWFALMEEAGVEVAQFRPLTWKRWRTTHRIRRKILICDGALAFTGGLGIAQKRMGDTRTPDEWRDTHFRIEGPAVSGLRAAFIGNWLGDERPWSVVDEFIPPVGQPGVSLVQTIRSLGNPGWCDVATAVRTALDLARHTVRITAAYFNPDPATRELLAAAVARGVRVQILTPGEYSDSRVLRIAGDRVVGELLDAGVEIARYGPTMLHTQCIIIDGLLSIIGSANFNQRSMRLDDEIAAVVIDPLLAARLDQHFDRDLRDSTPLDPERWRMRPLWRRTLEWLSGLSRWRRV
ncbi:MAG: phospholipase D-like domain-containing protein [Myxococcota bacterium]